MSEAKTLTWHPIATAPRDGTRVLVHDPLWGAVTAENDGEEDDIWWETRSCKRVDPTHWMPLPEPPA